MSATDYQIDPILTAQNPSTNQLKVIDQNGFLSMDVVTPIGRFFNISVDKPMGAKTADGEETTPRYHVNFALAPFGAGNVSLLSDLVTACRMIADAKWPELQGVHPETNKPGKYPGSQMFGPNKQGNQLHFPMRNGDEKYATDPSKFAHFQGLWFFNAAMKPTTSTGKTQSPIVKHANGSDMLPHEIAALCKPGCYGRTSIRVIPFEYREKGIIMSKGVTYLLQGVQYWRAGPAIGGAWFDRAKFVGDQFAAAGELPAMDGPNTVSPAAVPGWTEPEPGYQFGPAGGQQQPQAGYAAQSNFVPPNPSPQGYPRRGTLPPGT